MTPNNTLRNGQTIVLLLLVVMLVAKAAYDATMVVAAGQGAHLATFLPLFVACSFLLLSIAKLVLHHNVGIHRALWSLTLAALFFSSFTAMKNNREDLTAGFERTGAAERREKTRAYLASKLTPLSARYKAQYDKCDGDLRRLEELSNETADKKSELREVVETGETKLEVDRLTRSLAKQKKLLKEAAQRCLALRKALAQLQLMHPDYMSVQDDPAAVDDESQRMLSIFADLAKNDIEVPLYEVPDITFPQKTVRKELTVLRDLHLRPTASMRGRPVRTLQRGARLDVVQTLASNGFYNVRTADGVIGWVGSAFVRVREKEAIDAANSTPADFSLLFWGLRNLFASESGGFLLYLLLSVLKIGFSLIAVSLFESQRHFDAGASGASGANVHAFRRPRAAA